METYDKIIDKYDDHLNSSIEERKDIRKEIVKLMNQHNRNSLVEERIKIADK